MYAIFDTTNIKFRNGFRKLRTYTKGFDHDIHCNSIHLFRGVFATLQRAYQKDH
jgi:hypothetical protein